MSRNKPAGRQDQSVRKKVDWKALEIVHTEAAGIDVVGSEHWVAINPDRDAKPVRRFGCFTSDLHQLARWLVEKGVRSVAMQSTGVYWMPVFRSSGATRSGSIPGQCPAHEKRTGPQKRYSGVPMAAEITCIRSAE